jgi:hypothetical protein
MYVDGQGEISSDARCKLAAPGQNFFSSWRVLDDIDFLGLMEEG